MHRYASSVRFPYHFTSLFTALLILGSAGAWTTYVVPHISDQDDFGPLGQALKNATLTTNATILFEKGTTYNAFTAIKFPTLTNVEIVIEGNVTIPTHIATVQGEFMAHTDPRLTLKILRYIL